VDEPAAVLTLAQAARRHGVLVFAEQTEHPDEGVGIGLDLGEGGEDDRSVGKRRSQITQAADVPAVAPVPEAVGDFQDGLLPHSVDQQIRLGVGQDRAADGVRPVIVVGDPPQAGFNASQDDRLCRLEARADQVGVRDDGAVGAPVVPAAGSEIVGPAGFPQGGVVGDHGIDAPAGNAPE